MEILQQLAQQYGQTEAQVRKDMQEALDAAWISTDPNTKKLRAQLFPKGKPTPEQFIPAIARYIY